MSFPFHNAQLIFHASWSAPLVLVALAAAVALSIFLNRPTRRALGRQAFFLLGAEAVCATLLVLWLVNPRLRYEQRASGKGEIAVVVDRSLSMETRDAPGNRTRFEAARSLVFDNAEALFRQLGELARIRTYTCGNALKEQAPSAFPQSADPAGYGTDLRGALEKLGAQARAQQLQSIVLLSDGVHTEAGNPAEAARAAGVPVYTIGLGRPDTSGGTWRNAGITQVDVPTRVTVGQETEMKVALQHEGFTAAQVPVELILKGETVTTQRVRLSRNGRQEVRLKFTPPQRGTLNYTVRIPHLEGDQVKEDDAQDVTVMAADAKLKVLYVEGSLRWIYKFLKRIIEREASIQADCVICTGGGKMMQQGEGGLNLRGGLPADLAAMQKYDVIVLGDFPRALLDENGLKTLDQWVREKKGGLLVIGGPLVLDSGDYAGSALEALLPAQLNARADNSQSAIRNPQSNNPQSAIANPSLTSLGRGTTVLKGLEDFFPKLALRRVWGVRAPKPGAEVWMESGSNPLLLGQRYGEGRTMLVTSDDLWAGALRESGAVENSPTGKFWIQSLLWLAQRDGKGRDDDPLLMARCDRSFYAPGQTVVIQAQLRKPKDEKNGKWGTVKGVVRIGEQSAIQGRRPGGSSGPQSAIESGQVVSTLSFAPPDAQGRTTLEWKPEHDGPYTVVLNGEQPSDKGTEKGSVECRFTVGRPFRELERKGLDEDTLREIARASGGAYFTYQGAGALAQEMERGKARAARFVEKDLLDSPVFYLLFLGLMTADWITRRRRNLI